MCLCVLLCAWQVPPLAPNDPVMLAAARELATRAAEEQGRQQVRLGSEGDRWEVLPCSTLPASLACS